MVARPLLLLVVLRSLAGRRIQSLLVAGSIALATSVVATLLYLSIDVQRKVTAQVAEFGANVALVPAGERTTILASEASAVAAGLPSGSVASPLLYQRVDVPTLKEAVLAVGVDPATIPRVLKYRLSGQPLPETSTLPSGRIAALAGGRLARRAGFASTPHLVSLRVHDRSVEIEVVGLISTGGSEEDQLFLPLSALEKLSGLTGGRSALLVRVPGPPEDVARAVAALGPRAASSGVEAKLLRRVAAAAGAALAKIRSLLAILSVVVVVASLLSAGTVLTEQAIERRAEVGLMKSLGAADREVAGLMVAEAGILGLCGGVVGALLGVGVADVLERAVFDSPLALPPGLPPVAVLLGLLLAIAAVAIPLRASLAVLPAIALREDRP